MESPVCEISIIIVLSSFIFVVEGASFVFLVEALELWWGDLKVEELEEEWSLLASSSSSSKELCRSADVGILSRREVVRRSEVSSSLNR